LQVYCRKESHACRLFCRKTYEWLEAGDAPDHTTVSSPALKAEFRHKYGDTACMLNICFQSVKANLFCHIAVVVSTAYENIMPPIVLDSTQPSTPSSSQTSDSEGKELLQRRPTIYQQQPPGPRPPSMLSRAQLTPYETVRSRFRPFFPWSDYAFRSCFDHRKLSGMRAIRWTCCGRSNDKWKK